MLKELKGTICNTTTNQVKWLLQSKFKILVSTVSSHTSHKNGSSCKTPDRGRRMYMSEREKSKTFTFDNESHTVC